MTSRSYFSIGEVLALLLEEFPDVTISKIRFLESQGLVEPERTSSGYRKFYEADVERLRFVLREQKDNYLPLRVIKDRLDEDPTSPVEVPTGSVLRGHPAAFVSKNLPDRAKPQISERVPKDPTLDTPRSLSRDDLKSDSGITDSLLDELIRFGVVRGRSVGDETFFDHRDFEISALAARFSALGIDARHLKAWVLGAEREASLFEQRLLPVLRQRNPEARSDSVTILAELKTLSNQLHSVLADRATDDLFGNR